MNALKILTTILIAFILSGLFGAFIFYHSSDGSYSSRQKTEMNSVQVNILKDGFYKFSETNKNTVFESDKTDPLSIKMTHVMKTYGGEIFVYNDNSLNCNINETSTYKLNDLPVQKDAYLEIEKKENHFYVQFYNKGATGNDGPVSFYYKNRICSGIYQVQDSQ